MNIKNNYNLLLLQKKIKKENKIKNYRGYRRQTIHTYHFIKFSKNKCKSFLNYS